MSSDMEHARVMRPLRLRSTAAGWSGGAVGGTRAVAAVRIAFGAVWAIDAALKWRPSFVSGFQEVVAGAASGQPSWLSGWFGFWNDLVARAPHAFAYATALIETVIAAGLLFGIRRPLVYALGFVWSLAVWAIPEGFGGPYDSASTDIGTGIVYALLFAALFAADRCRRRDAA